MVFHSTSTYRIVENKEEPKQATDNIVYLCIVIMFVHFRFRFTKYKLNRSTERNHKRVVRLGKPIAGTFMRLSTDQTNAMANNNERRWKAHTWPINVLYYMWVTHCGASLCPAFTEIKSCKLQRWQSNLHCLLGTSARIKHDYNSADLHKQHMICVRWNIIALQNESPFNGQRVCVSGCNRTGSRATLTLIFT